MLVPVYDLDTEQMSFINGIYMMISFVLSSVMVLLVGWAADKFGLIFSYKIMAAMSIGSISTLAA